MQSLAADWREWPADRLEAELRHHNAAYWDRDAPEISDADYDLLVRRLQELRPDSAVLQALGPSDARRVARPVSHQRPMLSLDKAYDAQTVLSWAAKFEGGVVVSPKVDGVACSIRYAAGGALVVAATRGDGAVGEDITANVLRIVDVPVQIDVAQPVEVRGEVYLPLSRFEDLRGELANPRNAASGALKQKDADRFAAVGVRFLCYDVLGLDFEREVEKFAWAQAHGFTPVPTEYIAREDLEQSVQERYEDYAQGRVEIDYEIDGIVYRADRLDEQRRLGATSHHPRGAIAYKLQGEAALTVLEGVEWSVSRNGVLTPVGLVAPVNLSGAQVSRISLANWGLVRSKDLTIGAQVLAVRRGGVIPYLERVEVPGDGVIEPPARCPADGACAPKIEGDFICCGARPGEVRCSAQHVARLAHYAKAVGIEGFGEVWLDKLVGEGLLKGPADFYRLSADLLIGMERMGETLAKKLIAQIDAARRIPLAVFLTALGISTLGRSAGRALAARFRTLEAVRGASIEEIATLPKFAENTAGQVVEGLRMRAGFIEELLGLGVQVLEDEGKTAPVEGGPLAGQSFLFTGTLTQMARAEAQAQVVALGGSAASSVSRKLSFLVVGDAGKAGSKLTKAEELGIPVLSESAFMEKLAQAQAQAQIDEDGG